MCNFAADFKHSLISKMDKLKKVLSFCKKYIFIILSFVFFYVALSFKRDLNLFSLLVFLNVLSIFVILNILSKLKYSFILFLALVIACTVDTFFAFYYKDYILFGILASILETNLNEAVGVSMTMFPIWMSVFAACFVLLFFAKKELKEVDFSIKKSLMSLGIYVVILVSYLFYSGYTSSNHIVYVNFVANSLGELTILSKRFSPLIYYTAFDLGSYYKEMNGYKQYKTTERSLPQGVTYDKEKQHLEKVYVIIGESSSSKYFSLFGFPKDTSPFLDSLKQASPENMIYYQGIAPAPLTREAIRLTLSFTTPLHLDYFNKYKSLVEIANDAGYESLWLSNQNRGGSHDTYIVMMANEANHCRFGIDIDEDFTLIEEMKPLQVEGKKQIFFLHTLGSHTPYPDGADRIDIEKFPGEGIDIQYIRTIHHVDRFIHKIYDIVQNDTVPATLFYYSDHGELIGRGHGFINDVTPEQNLIQFGVPIIAIGNEAAKDILKAETFKRYYDAETKAINTHNMVNIIAETIGYNLDNNFVEQSVNDGHYIYHVDAKCYYYKELVEQE